MSCCSVSCLFYWTFFPVSVLPTRAPTSSRPPSLPHRRGAVITRSCVTHDLHSSRSHCTWRLSQLSDSPFSWAADCGGRWASLCAVFCVRYLCGQETIAPVSSRAFLSQFALHSSLQSHICSGTSVSLIDVLILFLFWGDWLWHYVHMSVSGQWARAPCVGLLVSIFFPILLFSHLRPAHAIYLFTRLPLLSSDRTVK